MPELPEVEVLVRRLGPALRNKTIREVHVHRAKVLATTDLGVLAKALRGARFLSVSRRGKYLKFSLRGRGQRRTGEVTLLGHLGMTGRMYLLPARDALPKHAAVSFELGAEQFVFEDTRYFGRLTLDVRALERLGPEPLGPDFTPKHLTRALRVSRQPIKVKLLDQTLVAGVGNIYASEALFRAGIAPGLQARRLKAGQVEKLWQAIREVLAEAIEFGSTVPLNFSGGEGRDGMFYYGRADGTSGFYEERLQVYDRASKACVKCGTVIKRVVQAARSTFYCPHCQRR